MKTKNLKDEIISIILIISCLIIGCSIGFVTSSPKSAGSGLRKILPIGVSLSGKTEFSFVPSDDNRVWHVINKYSPVSSGDGPGYNMSSYTFSSDSVIVINEYVGLPDEKQWDLNLSGIINEY